MSIPCCIYSPGIALAFPLQKISEGSRFGITNVWKWNLPLAVLTNPCFRLLSFERALMVKSLWPMPSTGRSCRRTPASHWMLDRIMLWQMMFRCVAQLVKTCWDALKASELEVFQSDRPIFCVCSPCLSMLQIHLQPLKKSICHVPREPNITLLLVCYTLVYVVLIWTMAIIVSIATSDSFYSYCCFNCFCSNFYGFVFGIVSFSIFTMSCNCSSCSYHCGFCCCCCKMQEVLMFVRCFLARRLCLKEGYRLRPLTAAWKSFDKSIKRYSIVSFKFKLHNMLQVFLGTVLLVPTMEESSSSEAFFGLFRWCHKKVTRGHDLDLIHMLIMLWLSLVWLLSSKPLKFPSPLGFTLGRGAKLFHA